MQPATPLVLKRAGGRADLSRLRRCPRREQGGERGKRAESKGEEMGEDAP